MKLLIVMLIVLITLYLTASVKILHNTKIIIENHEREIQKITLKIER